MPPRRDALLLMFLVSAILVAFEVCLTRICSAILQYHVSFAVVSVTILGLGIGGLLALLLRERAGPSARATLLALVAIPAGILAGLVVLLRLPFATHWPYLVFLVLPPFVAAGFFQARILLHFARSIGAFYAADLLGGATGAAVAAATLGAVGGPVREALLLSVLASAAIGLWRFGDAPGGAPAARRVAPWRWRGVMLVLIAGAAVLGSTPALELDWRRSPAKLITRMMQRTPHGQPLLNRDLQRWDAYSRVDVLDLHGPRGIQRQVFIDGETPTAMLQPHGRSPGAAQLDLRDTLPALPYRMLHPRRVLSIGSGAGYDVHLARRFDVEAIDAVELNAGVLEVVAQERSFTGDVYGQPGVRLFHAEGRHFVRAAPKGGYDLVVLLLAQSLAGNLQEYALSENYLYTVEAFRDYLDVLAPEGAVAMIVSNEVLVHKLVATASAALVQQGVVADAAIVALGSPAETPYDHVLVVRRRPFTPAQLAGLRQEIATRNYRVVHAPWSEAASRQALAGNWVLEPATDMRPFFFNVHPGLPRGLAQLLAVACGLALVTFALGWLRRDIRAQKAPAYAAAGYFAMLGIAFMMVEVQVLQRALLVLGFPTLNFALVVGTFLAGAGLGSALSARWLARDGRRRLQATLLGLALVLTLLHPALRWLHANADPWPLAVRAVAVVVLLLPIAFGMGIPFPGGASLLRPSLLPAFPWYWGLNGIASVLGSALAIAVVLGVGFAAASWVAPALYVVAAALAGGFARPPVRGS